LDEDADPKRVVEAGYDLIGARYGNLYQAHPAPSLREDYLALLLDRLEPGSNVLEIGAGNGVPVARALARQHRVTGLDISGAQVKRARRPVPPRGIGRDAPQECRCTPQRSTQSP
jgi:protein-L-isoaspartate O-methyltransferase